MVVEFSRRLRDELSIFQRSGSGHSRTRSSDTGRMSIDTVGSQESEGPGISELAVFTMEAFGRESLAPSHP